MSRITKDELKALSATYTNIKAQQKELDKEQIEIKSKLFTYFDSKVGKDKPGEVDCGDGYLFRREERKTKTLDEIKLEESVSHEIWKKITAVKREVDETKLKKAIAEGLIDKRTISKCVVEKRVFAFTHPTRKVEEEEII